MFERGINTHDVENVIQSWHVISEYPDDIPYPSYLLLGYKGPDPLHIVVGIDKENETCYIITVYKPDPELWVDGFSRRINK
ncbi:MAG TPA: DUF4258 domain-containing protein [Spirochaetota bacterium]|nr:DUF4258 domain-containing protein [Spirochaetota bacterium]HPC42656.1 DUF4258 domain-containing protein [Spirochaetota bacterium]HPL16249.1 DUF4258 domain-containing protein [Spirochaetota bacterium]HQF08424.1 DUF4258 domain-containing protein [Spirochaetota bacterium]HQH99062.1 DUF4258 domain-containing protein [Spirochaetota bacterium]